MNERTKQLAEQARKYYLTLPTGYKPEHVGMYRELMEKFAELIVRECCDWIDGSPSTDAGQLLLTKSFIIANLKRHFGVE